MNLGLVEVIKMMRILMITEKINKNHLFSLDGLSINFSSFKFSTLNKDIIKIIKKSNYLLMKLEIIDYEPHKEVV